MITRNASTTAAATAAAAAAALAALAWRRRKARRADEKAMAILAARNARMHSAAAIHHGRAFDVRASDVFVVTYPKCGTTWVSAIAHFLRGGDENDFGEIGEVMPWDIIALDCGQNCNDEQIRSPRLFKSHEAYDKIAKGGRYIYVSREPADALVSFYKFLPAYMHAPPMSIEAFCEGVFGGLSHSGGVWAHLCGWWARRRDANVCWVCYETLRAHPEREIARVARFMGVPDDAATVARVAACVEIKVLRRVRRVVLHAIDALPARWRGDARGRAAPGTRPPLAAGLIVGSAAGVVAHAVNAVECAVDAGADAVADGSGELPRRGFAIGFVWGTRHHAESAPAQDPDAERLDQDRHLAVVHWLIFTQVAARTSLAAMRAAGPKYDDHFVFHRLKGQIGIAGEHRASKVRQGVVGRGAALPASVMSCA